jgi:hypothetical protein
MAARLAPDNVQRTHQSLHHLVAESPWSDEAVLESVRGQALTAMKQSGPVAAWIVDDTGFLKKGTHSVGVARQYCGQIGKQDNCRVAVSLSVATRHASLPIAWRLYLPESWASDQQRRMATGVPAAIMFQTKPAIALSQIRQAVEQGGGRESEQRQREEEQEAGGAVQDIGVAAGCEQRDEREDVEHGDDQPHGKMVGLCEPSLRAFLNPPHPRSLARDCGDEKSWARNTWRRAIEIGCTRVQ